MELEKKAKIEEKLAKLEGMEESMKNMEVKLDQSYKENEGFLNLFNQGILSTDDEGHVRVVYD